MTIDELQKHIQDALKEGQAVRVETLRFLLAAVRNAAIAKYGADAGEKITPEDIVDIVKKQVKTHEESVEAFLKANRTDLVEREQAQLDVLREFAPKELTNDELLVLLKPVVAQGEQNFGKLMGMAMGVVKGQASGGRVSAILKKLQV